MARKHKPGFFSRVWSALSRDDVSENLRLYDGAKTGRRNDGWRPMAGNADAEIFSSLSTMRDRARDLVRNNPLATRIVGVLTTLVVGDGITTVSATGNAAQDKAINERWNKWCKVCDAERVNDMFGIQRLMVRSMFESGECLARFRVRLASDNLPIPMQVQVMEADLIDSSQNGVIDGKVCRGGIRYDALDRVDAYYMFKSHPGDSVKLNYDQPSVIPATEIAHLFMKLRPGQSRGVSHLAPVMLALRDLGDMQDAMLFREKLNASYTGFITRDPSYEGEDDQEFDNEGRAVEAIEPGMATNLRPGESWQPAATPGADSRYKEFVQVSEMLIAIGVGLTYDQMTGDVSQANFSSMKAGDRVQKRWISSLQWDVVIPLVCERMWREYITYEIATGKLQGRVEDYPARHIPPVHEPIERLDDLEADIMEMQAGGLTWSSWIMGKGWDPAEHVNKIKEDKTLLADAGIDLSELLAIFGAKKKEAPQEPQQQPSAPAQKPKLVS